MAYDLGKFLLCEKKERAMVKVATKNESEMPLLQKMMDSEEPATAAQ